MTVELVTGVYVIINIIQVYGCENDFLYTVRAISNGKGVKK